MKTAVVLLAAGKGTRMHSTRDKNKVVYELGHQPIIAHTLKHIQEAGLSNIFIVVGFAANSVKQALGNSVTYIHQKQRLGTGHALKTALKKIPPSFNAILSLYGDDSAFYPPWLYRQLVHTHHQQANQVTFITLNHPHPAGLGRIIRNQSGQIESIVEEKVATLAQKKLTEINTGLYCFDRQFLTSSLNRIKKNPISGEYYLTDTIADAITHHLRVHALLIKDQSIWFGINTKKEWQMAKKLAKRLV